MEKRNLPSFTWMYAVVLVLVALPTFIVGVYLATRAQASYAMLAAGCASIVKEPLPGLHAALQNRTRQYNRGISHRSAAGLVLLGCYR